MNVFCMHDGVLLQKITKLYRIYIYVHTYVNAYINMHACMHVLCMLLCMYDDVLLQTIRYIYQSHIVHTYVNPHIDMHACMNVFYMYDTHNNRPIPKSHCAYICQSAYQHTCMIQTITDLYRSHICVHTLHISTYMHSCMYYVCMIDVMPKRTYTQAVCTCRNV